MTNKNTVSADVTAADQALAVLADYLRFMGHSGTTETKAVETLGAAFAAAEQDNERLREGPIARSIEVWQGRAERAEARVTELERAHDRLARHHHKAQSHPRDFEVCTWPECRRARAVLGSVPHE